MRSSQLRPGSFCARRGTAGVIPSATQKRASATRSQAATPHPQPPGGMMTTSKRLLHVALVTASALVLAKSASVLAQPQGAPAGEWRAYGGDNRASKYSPLSQIDAGNFSTLQVAWRWKSADGFLSRTV